MKEINTGQEKQYIFKINIFYITAESQCLLKKYENMPVYRAIYKEITHLIKNFNITQLNGEQKKRQYTGAIPLWKWELSLNVNGSIVNVCIVVYFLLHFNFFSTAECLWKSIP